jgi:murein L,D-transpeptidase YcbB/YkuD
MAREIKALTAKMGLLRWLAVGVACVLGGVGAVALAQPNTLPPPGDTLAAPAAPAPTPAPAPAVIPQVALRPDQIALLLRTLGQADSHGFDPGAFSPPGLEAQLGARDPQARAGAQTQLVALTLRYANAVHAGRLPPASFLYEWGLKPAPYDPTPGFVQAVAQDRLGAWLNSLPPPYTGYDALRRGLTAYRIIVARGGWGVIAAGPDLKIGATGQRVAALRARLAIEDGAVATAGPAFDDALAAGVARAQKRFGLAPTGVVDKDTLAELNTPADQRVDQIVANMERWRWLPAVLPSDRIQVNIAAAVLSVFHDDTPVLSMRAATGRPGDETPMLQSMIHSIVLNPPWNVPSDIATKELWPKERAHPGYFKRNDFIVIRSPDGGARLQQKAGPKAALGHVKFDFVNTYGVYLHDTPNHGAFDRYGRLVSHGCVRLERPVVLANAVMTGSPKWTPDVIDQTIAGGDTVRASLPKPIAVFLLYWTAYVGPDGQVNFRGDPYNWDHILTQKLTALTHATA